MNRSQVILSTVKVYWLLKKKKWLTAHDFKGTLLQQEYYGRIIGYVQLLQSYKKLLI